MPKKFNNFIWYFLKKIQISYELTSKLEEEKEKLKLEGALTIQKLEESLLEFSEQVIYFYLSFIYFWI